MFTFHCSTIRRFVSGGVKDRRKLETTPFVIVFRLSQRLSLSLTLYPLDKQKTSTQVV